MLKQRASLMAASAETLRFCLIISEIRLDDTPIANESECGVILFGFINSSSKI